MKRILSLFVVTLVLLASLSATSAELDSGDSSLWAVVVTDQEPVHYSSESISIREFESYTEALEYMSSSLAERVLSLLTSWGPDSWMGAYQYDGGDTRYAILVLASSGKKSEMDSIVEHYLGDYEYSGSAERFSQMN